MHSAVQPASADLAATDPDGDRPDPVEATAFDTLTPIKRIVYIIKENRTFDHMFGRSSTRDHRLRLQFPDEPPRCQ